MNKAVCKAAEKSGCTVIYDGLLRDYTTFRVGGSCCIIKLNGAEACSELVRLLKENNEPYYILGRGSNIIADDKGVNGTVLLIGNLMSDKRVEDDIIYCDAGATLTALCNTALDNGLAGAEFAYGIPGTVGGAVYMNAGAYGGEIKDIILYAEAVNRETGELKRFTPEEMELSYRHSRFMKNDYIITSAAFKLEKGDKTELRAKMDELMEKRRSKQPLEYPSAGSTFKRPEGSYASLLIEQCGLKGYAVGGAEVSTKHSGFVINKNNASFDDIMQLIEDVKKIVEEKTGYKLECEPVIMSDKKQGV